MTSWFAGDLRAHPTRWLLVLFLVLLAFPRLDIVFSNLVYQPGVGFPGRANAVLEFVRVTVPDIIVGGFVLCVVLWLVGLVKTQWAWRMTTPLIIYLLLTILIGPGLIVETLLKPNWGRARPDDTTLFGGAAAYTPPWVIAHECDNNCSFVSGHAATAFWLTAFAFIAPPPWRVRVLVGGVVIGFAVGMVRMAQGGHFFSDVVGAGFVVLAVNALLARIILRPAVVA